MEVHEQGQERKSHYATEVTMYEFMSFGIVLPYVGCMHHQATQG
jgi:hypothetical protein